MCKTSRKDENEAKIRHVLDTLMVDCLGGKCRVLDILCSTFGKIRLAAMPRMLKALS